MSRSGAAQRHDGSAAALCGDGQTQPPSLPFPGPPRGPPAPHLESKVVVAAALQQQGRRVEQQAAIEEVGITLRVWQGPVWVVVCGGVWCGVRAASGFEAGPAGQDASLLP